VEELNTYSVLLADDVTFVREGLVALCRRDQRFRVVGQCSDGAEALQMIQAEHPDIAVLDWDLAFEG
jgi:two-component system nitrate/nitrite response regulator NarL